MKMRLRTNLYRVSVWAVAALLLVSGCTLSLPGPAPAPSPTLDPGLVITQAVATIQSQLVATITQAAAQAPTIAVVTPTPAVAQASPTAAQAAATDTPTSLPSATLPPPVVTSTPAATSPVLATATGIPVSPTAAGSPTAAASSTPAPSGDRPTVRARIATNCRLGNSTDFPVVGYFGAGATAEAHGRDRSSNWWYIRNPDNAAAFCWVWSGTTELDGDPQALQVLAGDVLVSTPQAGLATVEFKEFLVNAANIHECGFRNLVFRIINRSGSTFESVEFEVENLDRDNFALGPESSDAPFLNTDRTCDSGGGDRLTSGNTAYIAAPLANSARSGDRLRATFRFCSEEDLDGRCFERTIEFVMP